MRWTTAITAVALYTLGHGSVAPTAQDDVSSPGGALVAREVLDETLTAQRTLDVYQRPERQPLLPIFWKDPESAGVIEPGDCVTVIGVKETSLWRNRLVWLELERCGSDDESVWFRIGPEESASAMLWGHWERSSEDDEDDR